MSLAIELGVEFHFEEEVTAITVEKKIAKKVTHVFCKQEKKKFMKQMW
jgi:phytoene dehydrogenase-like protein